MNEDSDKYASPIEKRRRRLKDTDLVTTARYVKAIVWLAPAGVVFFVFVTLAGMEIGGMSLGRALLLGLVLGLAGPFIVYALLNFVVVGGAVFVLSHIWCGGGGTDRPSTGWRGQALAAHGSHAEALEAFEADAARDPGDPGPYLRAAAVCIEDLDDPKLAVGWYLRARDAQRVAPETDAYVGVRLAELYETIGEEGHAMVELRRLLQRHPDSPYAKRARAQLYDLKSRWIDLGEPEQKG
jgi:hypothetical protein